MHSADAAGGANGGEAWPLIDSHAHLAMAAFAGDLPEVLERAAASGVAGVLTAATSLADMESHVAVAESASDPPVWAAVGVHPHEARTWTDGHEEALARAAERPRVVAVGETGLDYHYDLSPRQKQREVLARQVRLAARLGLPIVVHCREAEEDVASILESEGAGKYGGVIHCFTGDGRFAQRCLELGFHISFSGILTFPNAADLREVAREIPASRLLVETDSPYLAPVPYRGRRNEPSHVRRVLQTLASLRGADPAEMAAVVCENFRSLFRRAQA